MEAFEKLGRLFKKLGSFCPNHPRYCGSRGNGRCQVCKDKKVIDIFDGYTTKKSYKINHKFSCYEKCLIYFFSCRTCGRNMRVRLLTVLGIGRTIIKSKQENLRVIIWKLLNKYFYKVTFYKMIKDFLEDVQVRLIDKTLGSDPTK